MRSLAAALIIAALALTGCGSSSPAATPPSARPAISSPTASPTPTGPAPVGTVQTRADDEATVTVTVLHVRRVKSHGDFGNPSQSFLAVEARTCVTKAGGAVTLSWAPWRVDYADDTAADPIGQYWNGEFDQPLYPADRRVEVGQCARGWIMFRPLRGTPVRVTYAGGAAEPASWRVPKGVR